MLHNSSVAYLNQNPLTSTSAWSQHDFIGEGAVMEPLATTLGAEGAVLSLHNDDEAPPLILNLLGSAVHDDGQAALALNHAIQLRRVGAARADQAVEGGWLRPLGVDGGGVLSVSFRNEIAEGEIFFSALLLAGAIPDTSMLAAAMRRFVPMLHLYFGLWQRYRREVRRARGIGNALDSMDVAVILMDRNGDVGFVNEGASALLDEGKFLRRRGRTLSAMKLGDTMKIQAAVATAITTNLEESAALANGASRGAVLLQLVHGSDRRILATIPAEQPATEAGAVAAMLVILDPTDDPERYVTPVCRLYGLSTVETRLACQLVAGRSLQEASQTMRIKEQTARSYLKQVFQKTGVKRQAELVRLLLSSLIRTRRGMNLQAI